MNLLKKFFIIGIGSNLVVVLAMLLLPAFLITDHVEVFEKLTSYISKE
ncbi:hypothetical protein [Ectobacillus panaciterrae]|nr:hypothetical protein [Ectobacillus panaciterrae]